MLRPLVGVRFQELFHSSVRGAFHLSLTVLVHYRSLTLYLALPDGPGRFTQDFSCPALLRIPLRFRMSSCKGLSPAMAMRSGMFHSTSSCDGVVLQPRECLNIRGLGSSPFARHYWGNHMLFSLPAGTKMFQFPAYASGLGRMTCLQHAGFSHSDIHGLTVICTSPWLFAAYHVLLRW